MALLAVDVSRLPRQAREHLHKVCTDENAMAMVQAKIRQQQTAKSFYEQPAKAIEGIGGNVLSIDPYWNTYFRMRYGDEVMHDPEFRKFIQREDEMFRVRCGGTRLQFGYTGVSGSATRKRFQKTYEQKQKQIS